jgi:anti-anti-sigma factor
MEITETHSLDFTVISVKGRIDSYTAPQFSESLRSLTQEGANRIILDLSGVSYISSAGLRVLIDIHKTCKRLDSGELILVNVPQRVLETLDLAGFSPLFRFFDNVPSAIKNR